MTGKKRKKLHFDARQIALAFSGALKRAVADRPHAAATLARIAGCNERTAENWLAGDYAPRAQHLLALVAEFDEVADAFLEMSGRSPSLDRERLERALAVLEGRE